MRQHHLRFLSMFLVIALASMSSPNNSPARDDSGDDEDTHLVVVVPAGTVLYGDYFAAGKIVEISGTVNGDVYAAGGRVLIDGTVNGDVLAAGGVVTISGTVTQDVRMAGGEVTIGGDIGRNVTVAGADLDLMPSALLRGNLIAAGANVELGAAVQRSVKVAAGTVVVSNRIAEHLTAAARSIRLTSRAEVGGNLSYWSEQAPSIDEQAVVRGSVIKRTFPEGKIPSRHDLFLALAGAKLFMTAASFVSTLLLGLVLLSFYPRAMQRARMFVAGQPLSSAGVGVLTVILSPLVAALLAATLVGFPLALLFLASFVIVLYASRVVAIAWLGQWVFERLGIGEYERWAFTFGLVLYFFLALIPFVGFVVMLLAGLIGVGALLLTKRAIYVEARAQEMV